jgi:hypothetical protein
MLLSSCETIALCKTLGHAEIATVVNEPQGPYSDPKYYDYFLEVPRSIIWSASRGSAIYNISNQTYSTGIKNGHHTDTSMFQMRR